mmetsp:Transcript_36498/g.64289  ORF Transcript_36498/g.64289 Transcript_36498/m.64289 type:complete len:393 (-) Transcript_36498:65-1243(-)
MRRTLACLGSLSVVAGKTYFAETFDDSWETRWVKSEWKEEDGTAGEFELNTGKYFGDEKEDRGLKTLTDNRFYDISANFPPFDNGGKDIIIQYQVKYDEDIDCGGGYIKVGPMQEDNGKMFGDPTEYNIMFGPDRCGYQKRTHLIFTYRGNNVLKKHDMPYKQEVIGTSHLYRLTLYHNNTCKVDIDEAEVYRGELKEDWELLKPKEIEDPNDKKPEDWHDNPEMDDPLDKKPDGWVEERRIPDPTAVRPDDWDDEEDGDWEAPMMDNDAWKGEWAAKQIKNDQYIGVWEVKKIPNPEYFDDPELSKFDFGFIGIDLWQVKAGTIFDNIIITDEPAAADAFAAKWKALSSAEKEHLRIRDENDKVLQDEKMHDADDPDEDDDGEDEKTTEEL